MILVAKRFDERGFFDDHSDLGSTSRFATNAG